MVRLFDLQPLTGFGNCSIKDFLLFKTAQTLAKFTLNKKDKKDKVNFNFYGVTALLTIVIHILPNISRSKGNQTLKYGQLECNTRNIFLEKTYTKCGEDTSPRPFSEKLKLSISPDQ